MTALDRSAPAAVDAVQAVDAVVIGAGPAGLFQVFQLGLQGIHAHIIDALPHPGGQCVELYGDKPIYDIPGVPVCTGRELSERLTAQIAPFQPAWHLQSLVAAVHQQSDGRLLVETSTGTQLLTRSLFIAAGVGAFVPRTLKIEGLDAFSGRQLHYQHAPAAEQLQDQHVVVHGGDEAAVACAVALARTPGIARVSLLYRRDAFTGPPELLATLAQLRAAQRITVVIAQIVGIATEGERLSALTLATPEGDTTSLPLDHLVAVLGVSPRLGPIADWGLAMDRKQLTVDTASFATSVPGIYAVGDIVTYPGKRKLIVCSFHEATMAAFAAAEYLSGAPVALQYTTTSTKLLQRLGMLPAAGA